MIFSIRMSFEKFVEMQARAAGVRVFPITWGWVIV